MTGFDYYRGSFMSGVQQMQGRRGARANAYAVPAQQQGQQPAPGMQAQQAPQQGQQAQGLPPTGIQQQLASLNEMYSKVRGISQIGFDPRAMQFNQAQQMQGQGALQGQQMGGATSLDQLARSLAQSYGLAIGRGRLVDDEGNLLMTPDQLANASGGAETLGSAAVKLQYISQAIAKRQNEQQQQKGIAAIQTGLGQVQSRGRGSLAAMQSGYYQDLADLYANQEYEAADFSYFVQKEQLDIQQQLQRRAEKLARRQARAGVFMGVAMMATGNYLGGAAMIGGSVGGTGWF